MDKDKSYMKSVIELAEKGMGRVNPNPMVGCIIVKNKKIVGKGYHKYFGAPHAEIEALSKAEKLVRGSTMYVNLEPCCHYGKTPPCSKAIIKAGIRKIIIAMKDPNPLVNGKGIKELRRNNIEIKTGVLEEEARKLNKGYIRYINKKKPFVILKTAVTLDGKIATVTGDSKWISSEQSRDYVHKLRSQVDAVLVGINTVLRDDPELTSRRNKKNPIRIVLDTYLSIPLDAKVLDKKANTVIVTGSHENRKIGLLKNKGVKVIGLDSTNGRIKLKQLIEELGKMSITTLLVEGGGDIYTSFLEQNMVDKVLFFIAPKIIGGKKAITPFKGKGISRISNAIKLKDISIRRFGNDILVQGYL